MRSLGDLTEWDRALIARHLPFYEDLANRRRSPTTDAQKRFVEVANGNAAPQTQHEIAFGRYLASGATGMTAIAAPAELVDRPRPGHERSAGSLAGG